MTYNVNPNVEAASRDAIVTVLDGSGFPIVLILAAFALAARLLSLPENDIYAASPALMEIGLALSPPPTALYDVPAYVVAVGSPDKVMRINRLVQFLNYLAFYEQQL